MYWLEPKKDILGHGHFLYAFIAENKNRDYRHRPFETSIILNFGKWS